MITVKEVLTTKPFANARIAAGHDGLDRQISSVTVAEVPDAANWLQGGELVCTTAYFIRQGIQHQIPWFESLIRSGAAAVAIKPTRFLRAIPHAIVDLADRYQIPLIEVSHEISWPSIIESVMSLLSEEQVKLIHSAVDIHRKLINLVLRNETAEQVALEIAGMTGNPVIIEDAHLNLIAHAGLDTLPIFGARLGEPLRNEIRSSSYYQDVLRGIVKDKNELVFLHDPHLRNLMVPIISDQTVYGFLSALYVKESYRLFDAIVLENGAIALSLQFMRQRMVEQTIQSKTSALIQDLINGRMNAVLMRDPQFSHIDWAKPLCVVVMDIQRDEDIEYDIWNRTNETIHQIIQNELKQHFSQYVIGFDGNVVTLLVSVPKKDFQHAPALLRDVVKEAAANLEKRLASAKLYAGVSRVSQKLSGLGQSHREATDALSLCRSYPDLGPIVLYEQLGVHRILSMLSDSRELRSFVDDFLSPLKQHDSEHNEDLLKTFYVYLTNNGSVARTASSLFVHPNTVLYRMKKIQSVLGRDIGSMDMRLTYLIALEANKKLEFHKY